MSAGLIAASVLAPIVGGIVGQQASRGDAGRQRAAIDEAMRQIMGGMPPDPEEQKVMLEELKRQGVLTPELEDAVLMQGTAFDQVKVDPRLKQAQLAALQRFQDVSDDGFTIEDKAALSRIQSENAAAERGAREAILSNARARGMGGSGMELAAQLQAQQSAANRNAQQGLDVAAQAQRRALEAVAQSGRFASDMRGQDFEEQARVAAARDAIQQFNANQRQGVLGRNADRVTGGRKYNLDQDQRIADANVNTRNQQQIHNKVDVYDKAYERDFEKRKAAAGVYGEKANYYGQQADAARQMWGGIGQGVGQGFAAYNSRNEKETK